MQNLYPIINAETPFHAGNAGLSKNHYMNETDLEKQLLASPLDEEEEEDDDDDDDDEDDDEDEDEDEDAEVGDGEDIDIDINEDEEGDLDSLDEDEDESDAEEDLASSSPVLAQTETVPRAAVAERPVEKEGIAAAGSAFNCYICEEPSSEICARCTRDTCDNHICERCLLCSDCCTCDLTPR